jgi:hypothetical protein
MKETPVYVPVEILSKYGQKRYVSYLYLVLTRLTYRCVCLVSESMEARSARGVGEGSGLQSTKGHVVERYPTDQCMLVKFAKCQLIFTPVRVFIFLIKYFHPQLSHLFCSYVPLYLWHSSSDEILGILVRVRKKRFRYAVKCWSDQKQ